MLSKKETLKGRKKQAVKSIGKLYSEATYKAFERQLAKDGIKSILKTQLRIQKNLTVHIIENGVTVKSYGTNDSHKPAHAHVKGGGKEVREGPNGKPLKGQPELTDKQKKVIDNNRTEIRKEVNAVGKENKKIEQQNQRR